MTVETNEEKCEVIVCMSLTRVGPNNRMPYATESVETGDDVKSISTSSSSGPRGNHARSCLSHNTEDHERGGKRSAGVEVIHEYGDRQCYHR